MQKLIAGKKIKRYVVIVLVVTCLAGLFTYIQWKINKPLALEMALYSGNAWNVPQKDAYHVYDEVAKMFESKYTDRKVKIKFRTGRMIQDYSEWFAEQVLKGKELDVFLILEEDFSTYASIGLLEDLTPYIENDREFRKEDFYQKALLGGQYYGRQYSLPFEVAPSFLVVNKTILKSENIEIDENNWNWNTFYDICRRVTKDFDGDGTPDQFGVYGFDWDDAFYTNDTALFSSDGKSISFRDDRMLETIDFMKSLFTLNRGTVLKSSHFEKGQVAFKTFTLPEYRAYGTYPYRILKYENFEWEAIPFPSGPNGNSSSKLYTVQIGMSSRSKHKNEAFEFIKFMTNSKEAQEKVWHETYTLPVLKSVVEQLDMQELQKNKEMNKAFFEKIIAQSHLNPYFKNFSHLKSMMDQQIFQIIAQDLDPVSGLNNLKAMLEKLIAD